MRRDPAKSTPPRPSRGDASSKTPKPPDRVPRNTTLLIRAMMWTLFGLLLLQLGFALFQARNAERVAYSEFRDAIAEQRFEHVLIEEDTIRGKLKEPAAGEDPAGAEGAEDEAGEEAAEMWVAERVPDDPQLVPLLEENNIEYSFQPGVSVWSWLLPIGLGLLLLSWFARRSASSGPGLGPQGVLGFGKSQARIQVEPDTGVTFDDVAGVDEAVEELDEIISFLKEPERYRRIGAKIPKGVLLVGPPGTGKTLLARAVAGHAGVPFFSLSGSEFMEMFVGVGAARVRDLFERARQRAPAIVFIDELDALAKSRGAGQLSGGGHDEREQTLNQLLSEMDGFDPRKGLIVLAATNRPEVLDQALLRPGRFDRQVLVDRPDRAGRLQILRIHAREVKLAADVNLDDIAARTPGFAGAELASVINEAALLAVRRGATEAAMRDLDEAIERVVAGLRRKNQRLSGQERERVAFHEAGHAVVGMSLPHADKVHKVSIVSRGMGALGYTLQLPENERSLLDEQQLYDRLTVLLGGRVAESMCLGSVSTGAADDLRRATELARAMVTEHGMSEIIGAISLRGGQRPLMLRDPNEMSSGRNYSEDTARQVDLEVKRLVDEAEQRARVELSARRDLLQTLAARLIEREVVTGEELEQLAREAQASGGTETPGNGNGTGVVPQHVSHQ